MGWVKKNKLAVVLILVILLLLFRGFFTGSFGYSRLSSPAISEPSSIPSFGGVANVSPKYRLPPTSRPDFAPSERKDRLIVEESSLSLVVLKVRETTDKVIDQAKKVGGFMVSSSLSQPEESPFATVIIRVPSDKLKETLDYYRTLAIKVSSENVTGTDVTDEYVDIESRLATLELTKTKFESILNQATQIQDILNVQRELINLQDQIDSLKGRQKYLEQTAHLAKITIYLSSDEFALPYAPHQAFRPEVIFKLAVRSLVSTLRGLASLVIWIAVYSVIWIPILILILVIRKRRQRKKSPVTSSKT